MIKIIIISLGLLILCGCASNLTDQDVERTLKLWDGAVTAASEAGMEGDLRLRLKTVEAGVGARQDFYLRGPVDIDLEFRAKAEPND